MNRPMSIADYRLSRILTLICCIAWPVNASAEPVQGVNCSASELLPSSTVAVVDIPHLSSGLHVILNHPLRAKLEAMPAYDAILQSAEFKQLQTGLRAFEVSMKEPWYDAIDAVTDHGLTLALDASDGGVAVLLHSSDVKSLKRFRGFILATQQIQGIGVKHAEYREFMTDAVGEKFKMVQMHDWLLLTNNAKLGKQIIDHYVDRDDNTLALNETYLTALKAIGAGGAKQSTASAFVDLATLKNAGVGKMVFTEKSDNFGVEAAVGGVLANVRNAAFATGQLQIGNDGLAIRFATPHERGWESPREYFFGEAELANAPPLLSVPDRLLALSAHRDLAQLWLRAADLLSDRANDQLAVADTTLTTLFSGRDFAEDILGSFDSNIQIVATRQDFSNVLPQPAIKLPAIAMVFRMKNPEQTQPELRRVFQSLIGFLNVTGAQNGQPQFDLNQERIGEARLVTASYVSDPENRESLNAKIQYNFSPTLAFDDDRIILSSTTSLSHALVQNFTESEASPAAHSNTFGELDTITLRHILESNRTQLVANNMLEKGHSKQAAEGEIEILLELLDFIRDVRINLDVTKSEMSLSLDVEVDANAEAQP